MTSLDDLPIRDDLRGTSPYGAPQKTVPVALNVNENTHPIPEDVAHDIVARVAAAIIGLNRYPDREFSDLRLALARYLGDDPPPAPGPAAPPTAGHGPGTNRQTEGAVEWFWQVRDRRTSSLLTAWLATSDPADVG